MSDYDAMMKAFEEQHGTMKECQDKAHREMWLGWLGVFLLGWEAHKRHISGSGVQ